MCHLRVNDEDRTRNVMGDERSSAVSDSGMGGWVEEERCSITRCPTRQG